MAELGIRPKVLFPRKYKDFHLVRQHGRVYGLPFFLGPDAVEEFRRYSDHPAVLSASTREELETLIDQRGSAPHRNAAGPAERIASCDGYELIRFQGAVYGVPQSAGRVDLNLAEERSRCGVIYSNSREEVEDRIRAARDRLPVEFAGWLPVFRWSRNCGRHPQFAHTAQAPAGYRFTCSAPPEKRRSRAFAGCWPERSRWLLRFVTQAILAPWALVRSLVGVFYGSAGFAPRARVQVLAAVIRLFCTLLLKGARPVAIVRFLRSRHFESQVLIAQRWRSRPGLAFLPSMPFTYGQNPWMIEIEDLTTLFCPFLDNGNTSHLRISKSPYFPIVKTLLESDRCKAIVTHMRSTAAMVRTLFGSERIANKVHHVPLGVRLPGLYQSHADEGADQPLHLLFINSWHQHTTNFYVRGGLDVLEAFAVLHRRYPRLRLTLRTSLPRLDSHYHRLIESGWVRVIGRFLSTEEMEALHAGSHIFLLPAARVHIVSLLQAMSHGLAVVTSDGWGIEEYVTHGRNGLVVKGRYSKVSWADEQVGMLREDYQAMYTPDPKVVRGIVEAVSRLVEDRALRRRLGRNARADVAANCSVQQWNRGLKAVLDQVMTSVMLRTSS
jgi:glycosyltransferase involved in cell wall biosynthesis